MPHIRSVLVLVLRKRLRYEYEYISTVADYALLRWADRRLPDFVTFAVAILRIEYYNTARRAIMTMSIICPPEGPLDNTNKGFRVHTVVVL